VKKHLLSIVLICVTLTTPATAQGPTYNPPPNWDAIPKRPGPVVLIPSSAPTGSANTRPASMSPLDRVAATPLPKSMDLRRRAGASEL
jgi:hypothetical protein